MKGQIMNVPVTTPMLFPYEPEQYWQQIREIIREELEELPSKSIESPQYQTSGMTYKPLYKMAEVCQIFQVSRPTIYDWVKHGKLKPYNKRENVFTNHFLKYLGLNTSRFIVNTTPDVL